VHSARAKIQTTEEEYDIDSYNKNSNYGTARFTSSFKDVKYTDEMPYYEECIGETEP